MAIVTRYFSTSGAGANDGTSWANRTTFFTGGAYSTVITGFNFAGSDGMLAYVGPGTHTITAALASGLFSVAAPTAANPLFIHGCDSSGVELTPPDPDWNSAAADWDDSGLAVLATTTNVFTSTLAHCFFRLLKFTASGITTSALLSTMGRIDWCSIVQSTSNTGALAFTGQCSNSIIAMTGANYRAGLLPVSGNIAVNVRINGITGSGGNRDGVDLGNTVDPALIRVTSVGHGGNGIFMTGGTGANAHILRCSAIDNGGSGIKLSSVASQTLQQRVINCLCTGNGAYGLDGQSAANMWMANNRFRDNTSGNTNGLGNYPSPGEYTTDSDDATEFVDSAGGDYRIDNAAATWGGNYGAGDGPAAGGGGGLLTHPGMAGGMRG